jgi:hypothetical protein
MTCPRPAWSCFIPRPLRWSEVPISFSRDDQWISFSEPGKFPLVLDPVVAEVRLTKVLIDGGSGLNLIFASTLRKMGLDFTDMLAPSKSPFYGIVPGNAAHPLGTMVLPVTFGTRENYRTEFIKFEVANFCGRTNLNYTGSSTQVHFLGLQRASNGIIPWPVG